ncbi:MAG: hypothetical protein GEU90_08915 [Gemmatimonas sp.]|nr:hypothetical protein [Gemmatimonas sp.]
MRSPSSSKDDLQRVVAYQNTAGAAFESTFWQMARHVVNHSSYHRGQVATLLRQLGHRPPATDLIAFFRETESPTARD